MRVISLVVLLLVSNFAHAAAEMPFARLLVMPEVAEGRVVSTMGVIDVGDRVRICLDAGSVENRVLANCIAVMRDDAFGLVADEFSRLQTGDYVLVIATFRSAQPKPPVVAGLFTDVVIIRKLPLLSDY